MKFFLRFKLLATLNGDKDDSINICKIVKFKPKTY